jgi:hypothetical protein
VHIALLTLQGRDIVSFAALDGGIKQLEKLKTDHEYDRDLLQSELLRCAGKTTFAENLINPRALEIATCVFGGQSNNKLEPVQSFNNPVKHAIQDLSAHQV